MFSGREKQTMKPTASAIILVASMSLLTAKTTAQARVTGTRVTVLKSHSASGNNLQMDVKRHQVLKAQAQTKTAGALPKTGVFAENEDMRPSDNKGILKIGVTQSIAWPGLYKAQRNLYSEQLKYYNLNTSLIEADLKKQVRSAYYQ